MFCLPLFERLLCENIASTSAGGICQSDVSVACDRDSGGCHQSREPCADSAFARALRFCHFQEFKDLVQHEN
eukprot:scaffold518649_cov14-Prasinocladus_malaysianus.AAC.1